MLFNGVGGLYDHEHNICVVGSGPVGLVTTLELARLGEQVTLIESGSMRIDHAKQQLSAALQTDPRRDVDMTLAVQRRFGGTSNLWGAGCVPLDPIDFENRPIAGSSHWPISYKEFATHLPAACAYTHCGDSFENALTGQPPADDHFRVARLMRYANPPSFRKAYARTVADSRRISAHLGVTVTGILHGEDGRVRALIVRGPDERIGQVRARIVVLACGGVETTRLMLASRSEWPRRYGGEDGPLGRYFMGHLSGAIADVHFANPAIDGAFDFFKMEDKGYARRRITAAEELQRSERLPNIAFWPTLPPMKDSANRDPVLSLAYLALSIAPVGRALVSESLRRINVGDGNARIAHLRNVIRDIPSVACFLPRFLHGRYLARRRLPGLHLRNRAMRYMLHYHAEHLPNAASRLLLSPERDALGLNRISVDLRFSRTEAESIVRSHQHLQTWLKGSGLGKITWHQPVEDSAARVLDLAGDGVHQIGTARMGNNARDGVVDRDCRVFGTANLFLAGSAVFPTSGQANPTLSAIALAIREAALIAREVASHVPM